MHFNRWAVNALACSIVALLVAGTGVLVIRSRDTATPLTVDAAVEQFLATTTTTISAGSQPANFDAAGGAPVVHAQAPETNAQPPSVMEATSLEAPAAPAGAHPSLSDEDREQVVPGVYVYDTTGFEEIDMLGGARHDYPSETTITYDEGECGVIERWAPLEQRSDARLLCPTELGDEVRWLHTTREFFGQAVDVRFDCTPPSVVRPARPESGRMTSFACTSTEGDSSTTTVTEHGLGPVTVAGQTVDALRVDLHVEGTGRGSIETRITMHLHASSGLLLSRSVDNRSQVKTPTGTANYREQYTVAIRSLDPASR